MGLSPVFTRVLSEQREGFNRRVGAARVRNPGFDTAAFTAFLEAQADPLLQVVLAQNQGDEVALVDALFDAAITLTEHRWVGQGARAQLINRLWSDVLPAYAPVIASTPKVTIAAFSNATIKVSQAQGVRIDQWLGLMASLGDKVRTLDEARSLVVICAWRSGVSYLRDVALAGTANLPPDLACAAVGAKGDNNWGQLAEKFATHLWWAPDARIAPMGYMVGGFTGFGGHFSAPPKVVILNDRFVAQSGGRNFVVCADAYGATLRPIDRVNTLKAMSEQGQEAGQRLTKKGIRADDRVVALALPSKGVHLVETSDSIAACSPYSHNIQVFPKVLP